MLGLQAILAESSRCRDRLSEDQIVLQGSISEVSLEVRDVVTKTDLKLMNENCDLVRDPVEICPPSTSNTRSSFVKSLTSSFTSLYVEAVKS
jgi:hypothetical protein